MFNNYNDGTFKRVTKTTANKLYNAGKEIYLLPCKACLHSYWIHPFKVSRENTENFLSFNHLINNFEFYNCNSQLGKYASYYIAC